MLIVAELLNSGKSEGMAHGANISAPLRFLRLLDSYRFRDAKQVSVVVLPCIS